MESDEKLRGGLALADIVTSKPLFEADSCLEYLLLSLCNNLSLLPKQAAGLLMQDNRYLKKVMSKGLKGDFTPLRLWYQDIYSNTERLCDLVKEEHDTAASSVLGTLQLGFNCEDEEVRAWTCRLFSKLSFEFEERRIEEYLWTWLVSGPIKVIVELCVMEKVQLEMAVDLLLHLSQGKLIQLFSLELRDVFPTIREYLDFASLVMDTLLSSDASKEELQDSGVITYWTEICLREAENLMGECRLTALIILQKLWLKCMSTQDDEDSTVQSIQIVLKRGLQDHMEIIRTSCCVLLFDALEHLVQVRSTQAPGIYKSLALKLVEEHSYSPTAQFVLSNFTRLFVNYPGIPLTPLMNIICKKYISEGNFWTIADIDLFAQIARHQKLCIEEAIQVIDICGRIYLTDSVYVRAASVPLSLLATRYLDTEIMQEYLLKLSKVMLISSATTDFSSDSDSEIDLLSRISQRNMNMNLLKWLIQLGSSEFNQKLGELISALNREYKAEMKSENRLFREILMELPFVQSVEMEGTGTEEELQIVPVADVETHPTHETIETEPYSLLAIRDDTESVLPPSKTSHSSAFPHRKVQQTLERIRKIRVDKEENQKLQIKKALKMKENQDKVIKQQLEMRKIEQGVFRGISDSEISIYPYNSVKIPSEIEENFTIFTAETSDFDEIRVLNRKYYRVFKAIFQKFAGSGFAVRKETGSMFEWLAERKERLKEAELVKVLVLFRLVPGMISKEEVRNVLRQYCAQVAHQHDLGTVDFEGFTAVLSQIAYFIYSPVSTLPSICFKLLILKLRESSREVGISLDMFDECDPGPADKDVAYRLNALLRDNPDTPLPPGFRLTTEHDIEVVYAVPTALGLPDSVKYSLEILDDLVNSTFNVHLLEVSSRIKTILCAKGGKKEELRPLQVGKYPHHVLSPGLKLEIAKMDGEKRQIAYECAQTLETLLISVTLGLGRVIHRPATQVKLAKKPDISPEPVAPIRREDWRLRAKEVQERMMRSVQTKLEKRKKEEAELAEKLQIQAEESKKQTLRAIKEKENRAKLLKEWMQKKEEEKNKNLQDLIAAKAKLEKEKIEKHQSYRQLHTRLEAVLKAKQDQWREMRANSASAKSKALEAKSLHQLRAQKLLNEEREKTVARSVVLEQSKAFMTSTETVNMLNGYGKQISAMYEFFMKKSGGVLDNPEGLKLSDYAKLAVRVDIVPSLLTADVNAMIYKSVMKGKEKGGMQEPEFRTALLHITELAKDFLNGQPDLPLTTDTLKSLLTHLHLTQSVASLTQWLTHLYEVRSSSVDRKKTPSRNAVLIRPSLDLPITQEADNETDSLPAAKQTNAAALEAISKEIEELERMEEEQKRLAQEAQSQREALLQQTGSET